MGHTCERMDERKRECHVAYSLRCGDGGGGGRAVTPAKDGWSGGRVFVGCSLRIP